MNNLENLINKKVLITGNTGFKGAWLSILLDELGADVYGLADKIPWENGIFSKKSISKVVNQSWIDILDYQKVQKLVKKIKPDFVFHLAAQPLVLESHVSPRETFLTNINGTVNILESIRKINPSIPLIIITSDKVYKNDEKVFKISTVITILGIVNIPIIKYSVDWWNTLHQPASINILSKSSIHSSMLFPLLIMTAAFALFSLLIFLMKYNTELIKIKNKGLDRL